MKKIILGLSLFTFIVLASSMSISDDNGIRIENNSLVLDKTVVRKVGNFEGIKAGGAVSIKIVDKDNDGQIIITTTDEVLGKLKTVVKDGILEISMDHDSKFFKKSKSDKIEITISHRKLRELDLSGASNLVANHTIKVEKFKVDLSGAANASLNILANNVDVDLSGASKLSLSGNVQNLELESSGASNFLGENLKANSVNCDLSGASKAKVWAISNLKADTSGASSVSYKNVASLSKDVSKSGASSVKSF